MKIILPRGLEVDLDNIPEDLEEQVQKCFAEYTKGTRPDFMYHDKMLFIDVMAKRAHGGKDPEDTVMDAMKDYLEYRVNACGEIPDASDYLDTGFMEHCYLLGVKSTSLYDHEFIKDQGGYDDKIIKVLCRAVKAVMDYEWGKDGVNG